MVPALLFVLACGRLAAPAPACTSTSKSGHGFSVQEKTCVTPDGALTLTTRVYETAPGAAVPLTAQRACQAPRETYALQFESITTTTADVVTIAGQPACAMDVVGTHGTSNGPWRVREIILPTPAGRTVFTVTGTPQAFAKHAKAVDAFFIAPLPTPK
jgi:hypothetical protein